MIALSSTTIQFYGKEDTILKTRNLIIIGLEDRVNVTLVPTDLYSNGTDESIFVNLSENNLLVNKTNQELVKIELSSPDKAGTYNGVIMVIASIAGENFTTTYISVVAVIETAPVWSDEFVKWGIVVFIGILVCCGMLVPDYWKLRIDYPKWKLRIPLIKKIIPNNAKVVFIKKYIVVISGIIVAFLWFFSLLSNPFGDPAVVLQTVLITPFITYALGIVKDQRTERLEKEKASRTIRDDGIKKDIDLIRKLIGEMATHYASFNPNCYEEKLNKPPDDTPYLLYHKTGLLSKKVWDESCKQGFVADIHTLHLENYYDHIPFYNQCYIHAMTLISIHAPASKQTFLKLFENFRKTYGELQKVLFVYLSYTLELFSKTVLSPMKLEYPRITRTLLYNLIDYEILIPFQFIERLSRFNTEEVAKELVVKELARESVVKELKRELAREFGYPKERLEELQKLVEKLKTLVSELSNNEDMNEVTKEKMKLLEESKKWFEQKNDWKDEFKNKRPDLKDNGKQEFKKAFIKYIIEEKLKNKKEKIKEFEVSAVVEAWVTIKFKEKIEWWRLTAEDLEIIVNDIYEATIISHFYRHVQDDFQKTYLKLKEDIKKLSKEDIPALPKKILGKTSPENAFNFYSGPDQPLGVSSDSLVDLCKRIRSIDIKSIEYHLTRGDFESWIRYLGDVELEKRLKLIKKESLKGETLRNKLYEEIKSRCDELRKVL